ncbi:hypothetical protein CGC20_32755 [Leishmania donovani]|uniref:Uncharacterized protein n=1 Tax=Leishmania donovani TaxID=5661 RepID=A0A504XM24_LEIDO|nr:hypothetical protein CGC20_32755 [Leishmania donovani]
MPPSVQRIPKPLRANAYKTLKDVLVRACLFQHVFRSGILRCERDDVFLQHEGARQDDGREGHIHIYSASEMQGMVRKAYAAAGGMTEVGRKNFCEMQQIRSAVRKGPTGAGDTGTTGYSALLDFRELGSAVKKLAEIFEGINSWLPQLIHEVEETRKDIDASILLLHTSIPISAREAASQFSEEGQLDTALYPFSGMKEASWNTTDYSFTEFITPLLQRCLGDQPAFTLENVRYLITVIMRLDIERALIEGELEPMQGLKVWADRVEYFGIGTCGHDDLGCMQNLMATIAKGIGDNTVNTCILDGDMTPPLEQQRKKVWSKGCMSPTIMDVVVKAIGNLLTRTCLCAHLERHHLRNKHSAGMRA